MDKFVFVGKSFDRQDVICAIELVTGIKLENVLDATIVNYPHLKEGASPFNEAACIKVSLNVEVTSPGA